MLYKGRAIEAKFWINLWQYDESLGIATFSTSVDTSFLDTLRPKNKISFLQKVTFWQLQAMVSTLVWVSK